MKSQIVKKASDILEKRVRKKSERYNRAVESGNTMREDASEKALKRSYNEYLYQRYLEDDFE